MSGPRARGARLCPLDAIPDGGAKGVEVGEGPRGFGVILLREGDRVRAYLNRCPHQGTPLETFPDRFLDRTGRFLICTTHGARFRRRDGRCVEGPCLGAVLAGAAVRIEGGSVMLEDADGLAGIAADPLLFAASGTARKSFDKGRA